MTAYSIDFGFEGRGVSWDDAKVALLLAGNAARDAMDSEPGPTALADASRYIELFEMQVGVSPMDVGVYTEVTGGKDPVASAAARAEEARRSGKFTIVVAGDRSISEHSGKAPLVALWGKLGRPEVDEETLFHSRKTILVGVRAATSTAFKVLGGDVAIVTPRAFISNGESLKDVLDNIDQPVQLSIDLDVLSPAAAQNNRSVEPGGFSWYDLMDILNMVFAAPGVSGVDITGTGAIQPRTSAASIGAQLILNIAGLFNATLEP
jgi:arginase family enzyme